MRILPSLSRPGALLAAFMTAATTMFSGTAVEAGQCIKSTIVRMGMLKHTMSNVGGKSEVKPVYIDFCKSARDPNVILYGSTSDLGDDAKKFLIGMVEKNPSNAGKTLVDHEDNRVLVASLGGGRPQNSAPHKAAPVNTMMAKAPAPKAKPTAVAAAPTKPAVKKIGWTLNLAKLKLPQVRPTALSQMAAASSGFVAAPASVAVPSVRTIAAAQPGSALLMGEAAPRKDLRDILAPAQNKVALVPAVAPTARAVEPVMPQANAQSTKQEVSKPEQPLVASMPAVALRAGRSRITREASRAQGRSRTAPTPNYPLTSQAYAASKGTQVAVYG